MTTTPTKSRISADGLLRRIHRIAAILFLIAIPPAAIASNTTGEPSPVVYLPLFPLLFLALTGCYQLIMPWIRRRRAGADAA